MWRMLYLALTVALTVSGPVFAQEVRPPASPGLPVDKNGNPTIDPTENVKALTAAGLKTAEELRIALKELLEARLDYMEKLSKERDKHQNEMNKISIDSAVAERNSELKRIDQVDKLRAEFNDKMAAKEQDRINSMRLLDVGAAADLQRRTTDSATALQTQTATLATDLRTQTALLAENLRSLVLSTATQQAAASKQTADEISKRLTSIEQAQSEGRGKQAVSDPALGALVVEVQKLSQQRADTAGGSNMAALIFGAIATVLIILIAFGGLVIALIRRSPVVQQQHYGAPMPAPPGWQPPTNVHPV